jgi:AraC-like DNA-binding protein
MPPVVAAASAGFADQSHFTGQFKRMIRVPSSEYARAMRQQ